MRRRIALLIGLAALVPACVTGTATSDTSPSATTRSAAAKASSLRRFGSCQELVRYARRNARRVVGPFGLVGSGAVPLGASVPGAPVAAETGAPARGDLVPATDFSTTNVQEAGVDEPDLVKTDGSYIFAIAQGKLQAVDVQGAAPRLLGSLPLEAGWSHQLLLRGNRLLVLSNGWPQVEPLPPAAAESRVAPYGSPVTVLAEVDVTDPGAMRVIRTLSVDGAFLAARLVDSTARVVISTAPAPLEFVAPASSTPKATKAAERRNRAVIGSSKLTTWLPSYVLQNRKTGRSTKRPLIRCRQVRRAPQFSGLGTLTVLTIDLDKGLQPVDSDAVMTGGETVYASKESLYVATQQWVDQAVAQEAGVPPKGLTTALHKFDISDPATTAYRGSGEVRGSLLSQWSLSEHNGRLRVASTDLPAWWGDTGQESESFVTVLEDQAGRLVEIGRVGELGRGERIYAVRFIGDVGYVVTFRQVDPLYTVDLSDPTRPAVLGELKIPGYSAYLHPIGEDLLLGVGQDATDEGRILGSQVSVFDISDLRKPARLHHRPLGQGSSEAEFDHHAFLHWPATGLAVLPIQTYTETSTGGQAGFVGAIGVRVRRASGIEEIGRISHDVSTPESGSWQDPIRRSIVVGDTLFTVSELGLKASSLQTLAARAWVAFG